MSSSAAEAKSLIRGRCRRERRGWAAQRQRAAATALAALADEPPLREAATVAAYMGCDGELDPAALLTRLRGAGTAILLPRTGPDHTLELAWAGDEADYAPTGPAGIPEPRGTACAPADAVPPAILLVPSVALARDGGRLGRGGGYYDRFLPKARAAGWLVVGVCHGAHIFDQLPLESHDQRVDALLSEDGWEIPEATP